MSEQALDLRATWAIARRRAWILALAAAIGAVDGGVALSMRPPEYSSTSKVLLPVASQGSTVALPAHGIDTQVQIAQSEAVLGPAGQAVTPALTATQVAKRVTVKAATTDLMSITATGTTPEQARALSGAVAQAELDYLKAAANTVQAQARGALSTRVAALQASLAAVNSEIKKTDVRLAGESPSSPAGKADAAARAQLTAQQGNLVLQVDKLQQETANQSLAQPGAVATLIEAASPAVTTSPFVSAALFGVGGAAAGALLVLLILVLRSRRERAVRSRDQIADAVGIPVVASIESHAPRSVAGWTGLLKSYAPHNVETWTLRQLVRLVTPGHPGSLAPESDDDTGPTGVVFLTLSGDVKALAVGPQLASFAASSGLQTQLLTAQMHESANALRVACAGLAHDEQPRPRLSVDGSGHAQRSADLVVHIAVADRQRPELRLGVGKAVILLAVTAGSATAEDLARVALAADDSGNSIARIVVVDPDPLDRTTGRLLPSERAAQVPLPSLMTGTAATTEATALRARRRLR